MLNSAERFLLQKVKYVSCGCHQEAKRASTTPNPTTLFENISGFYLFWNDLGSILTKTFSRILGRFISKLSRADYWSMFRCRVVSCDCSCPSKSAWCQHVVALCLYRIHRPDQVQFRCFFSFSWSLIFLLYSLCHIFLIWRKIQRRFFIFSWNFFCK